MSITLFMNLGEFNRDNNTTRFVNVNEFVGNFTKLQLGNGGSWCRRDCWKKYKCITVKTNGNITFLYNVEDDEKKYIENEIEEYRISNNINHKKGNSIQLIKIVGLIKRNTNRPIREDIKKYYKKKPCVACGSTTNLECDHKNDLYNDPRVLNVNTQTFDDFQSLCKHCNDRKRQVIKDTKKNRKEIWSN